VFYINNTPSFATASPIIGWT